MQLIERNMGLEEEDDIKLVIDEDNYKWSIDKYRIESRDDNRER
jgi:hypothetical protein